MRRTLDRGLRPCDMKLSIEGISQEGGEDEIAEELTKLGLHDEKSIEKSTKH